MRPVRFCFYHASSFNVLPALVIKSSGLRVECIAPGYHSAKPLAGAYYVSYAGVTVSVKWLAWSAGVALEWEAGQRRSMFMDIETVSVRHDRTPR